MELPGDVIYEINGESFDLSAVYIETHPMADVVNGISYVVVSHFYKNQKFLFPREIIRRRYAEKMTNRITQLIND